MAQVGFQVDESFFDSRLGTLARMWRDVAEQTDDFFTAYTDGDLALKVDLLAKGYDAAKMNAANDVIFAMKNLSVVAHGGSFPQTDFLASIRKAAGI